MAVTITKAILDTIAGRDTGDKGKALAVALTTLLPKYDVQHPRRVAHFLAQAAHETGGFKHFVELGNGDGPDADPYDDYLERYDGRADLGNVKAGDGEKYRGRGIFQLTGRANYRLYGSRLGVDLENNPVLAAEPETAVKIACLYWNNKGLSAFADKDDVQTVTKRINGGYNGLNDRIAKLAKAKAVLGVK